MTVSDYTTVSICPSNNDTETPRFCSKENEKCNCSKYRYNQTGGCDKEKYCDADKKNCNCTEGYKECDDYEIWVGGVCVSGIQMMIEHSVITQYIINVTFHGNVKFS